MIIKIQIFNMKKRYIHPEVQVFNVKAQNLLAGSLDVQEQNGGTLNAREFNDELEF